MTKIGTYYISPEGKLCNEFHSPKKNELVEVIGCMNETWFMHQRIKIK